MLRAILGSLGKVNNKSEKYEVKIVILTSSLKRRDTLGT